MDLHLSLQYEWFHCRINVVIEWIPDSDFITWKKKLLCGNETRFNFSDYFDCLKLWCDATTKAKVQIYTKYKCVIYIVVVWSFRYKQVNVIPLFVYPQGTCGFLKEDLVYRKQCLSRCLWLRYDKPERFCFDEQMWSRRYKSTNKLIVLNLEWKFEKNENP